MGDDGGEVGVLRAAEELGGVEVGGPLRAMELGVDLHAGEAGAQREGEAVVGGGGADAGADAGEVEGAGRVVLHAQVDEGRAVGDLDVEDGVVEVGPAAVRDIDQGEAGAFVQADAVAEVEGDGLVVGKADAGEEEAAGIDAGGHLDLEAVLGEHGVEQDHGVGAGVERGGAHVGVGRQRGGGRIVASVDEHRARAVDARDAPEQVRAVVVDRVDAAERDRGERAEAGVVPVLVARSGQAGLAQRLGGVATDGIGAQRPLALEAREEAGGARGGSLGGQGVHAASSITPA